MPKIRCDKLPGALMRHLIQRMYERHVPASAIQTLADWLNTQPEVPHGRWFKKFPGMIVCGEGELVKTFLLPQQVAAGEEVP